MDTEQEILISALTAENSKLSYMALDNEYRITRLEKLLDKTNIKKRCNYAAVELDALGIMRAKYPAANIALNTASPDDKSDSSGMNASKLTNDALRASNAVLDDLSLDDDADELYW